MRTTKNVASEALWYWLQIKAVLGTAEQWGADKRDVNSLRLIVSRKLHALESAQVN